MIALRAALVACFLGGSGCAHLVGEDLAWGLEQAIGQGEVLLGSRSVVEVLRQPEISAELRHRLRLLRAVRTFARDELGLDVGQQYRRVTFLDAPAVVYVVSAAPQTSLDPYEWSYPVVGALPYRGHFELEAAEALAARLVARGYDVSVGAVPTYSLLGMYPEPVVSPMLFGRSEAVVVETVIHELAHATIFVPGQGAFNEGLASFIGREGRRRFVAKHYGETSAIAEQLAREEADQEAYRRAVAALAFELRVLYAQRDALDDEGMVERKADVYRRHQARYQAELAPTLLTYRYRRAILPDNNAALSSYGIYSLQEQLYERGLRYCDEDMRCFLRLLRDVALHREPELQLQQRLMDPLAGERVLR